MTLKRLGDRKVLDIDRADIQSLHRSLAEPSDTRTWLRTRSGKRTSRSVITSG